MREKVENWIVIKYWNWIRMCIKYVKGDNKNFEEFDYVKLDKM